MILDRTTCRLIAIGFAILFFHSAELQAQSSSRIKRMARIFYQENQLAQAHPYFIKSINNGKKSCGWLIKASESCLAVNDLSHAKEYLSIIIKEKGTKKPLAIQLMGIALQREHKFDDAINMYKKYLKSTSQKDNARQKVKYRILQCRNGIQFKGNRINQEIVKNLGSRVNNNYSQFGLVQSALDENKYYFSGEYNDNTGGKRDKKGLSNDKYGIIKSDIYKILIDQGIWNQPNPINKSLNTSNHDVILSLGHEGQSLIYYRGINLKDGNVYVDSFDINQNYPLKNNNLLTDRFNLKITADKGLYIYRDSILFFSSDKKGGFGGYDLYMSINKEGYWLNPVNLGPQINSPFDEITPYMSNDGRSFYFSSNSTKSMGGFDVFNIIFEDRNKSWSDLKNLGIPINSASDDTHYQGSMDGFGGSITSDRPGGFGQSDLYYIYYEKLHKEELTLRDPNIFSRLYYSLNELNPDSLDIGRYSKNISTTSKRDKTKAKIYLEQIINTQKDFMFLPKNRSYFDEIARVLKNNPSVKIKISSYVDGKGKDYRLIITSKERADKVRAYLNDKGIKNKQIITIGYGNTPSLIKQSLVKSSLVGSQKQLNNRLDFDIIDEGNALKVDKKHLEIPDNLRSFRTIGSKGLNYKIRLVQSNQILANPLISRANKATLRQYGPINETYYFISEYDEYKNALSGIKLINPRQFSHAIVVPFMGDEMITRQQIVDYSITFPDLSIYLKSNP